MKKILLKLQQRLRDWMDREDGDDVESRRTQRKRELNQVFQLEIETLRKLEKVANGKNISLQSALEQAVNFYSSHQSELLIRMNEDRKERNPLLRLGGLLSNKQQAKKKEELYHDERTRIAQ